MYPTDNPCCRPHIRSGPDTGSSLAALNAMGVRAHVRGPSAAADLPEGVRLDLYPGHAGNEYANAQLDDYRIDTRNTFRWNGDVELLVRARFSHPAEEMTGTAGFGFWNAPVGLGVRKLPSPPAAAWFFFSGPNSAIMPAQGQPAHGWKAASMDARNRLFWLLLPTAPVALPLMRIHFLYRRLWPIAQRAMKAQESIVAAPIDEWHDYSVKWTQQLVTFRVDNEVVHICTDPPRGKMGFVAWIDNQYMVATPQGRFSQGTVPLRTPRYLEFERISLKKLS